MLNHTEKTVPILIFYACNTDYGEASSQYSVLYDLMRINTAETELLIRSIAHLIFKCNANISI